MPHPPHPCPHHCPGGAAGGSAAGAVVVMIIVAVLARPVAHAAASALRVLVEILQVAAVIAMSAAGLAVIAGATVVARRVHGRRARAQIGQARQRAVGNAARPQVTGRPVYVITDLSSRERQPAAGRDGRPRC